MLWHGDNRKKADRWSFDRGLIAPNWDWFWESCLVAVPVWNGALPDIDVLGKFAPLITPAAVGTVLLGNDASGRVLDTTATNSNHRLDGGVYDYIVDPFTMIMGFSMTSTTKADMGGDGDSASNTTYASFTNYTGSDFKDGFGFFHRGSSFRRVRETTSVAHKDGLPHIAIYSWNPVTDTALCWLDYTSITVTDDLGVAPFPATTFNTRTVGGFTRIGASSTPMNINLWAELDIAVTEAQAFQIVANPFGPFRKDDALKLYLPGSDVLVAPPTDSLIPILKRRRR